MCQQLGSLCPHQLHQHLVLWRVMALEVANRTVRQGIEIGKRRRPDPGACALALAKKVHHRQRRHLRRPRTIRTEIAGSERRLSARKIQKTPQSLLRPIPAYSLNGSRSTVTDTELQGTVPAQAHLHARHYLLLKKVERTGRTETYLSMDTSQFPICSIYTLMSCLYVLNVIFEAPLRCEIITRMNAGNRWVMSYIM